MAITKEIIIDVETGQAVQSVNKLNESVEQVEQTSKDLEKQNKSTKTGFKGVSAAVKGLGTALKAAGIGLVIAAFAKLSDLLSQNQKVVDIVNTAWTSLSIVFQDLFSLFDEGLPSIQDIGTAIKENLIERFQSALKVFGFVGKAFKQLFERDFKGAFETAKLAGKELIDVATGIDNSADKIANYASEVVETADAFTQLENQAKLAEAQLRRVFEQSDRDAEIQRRIRDDFNLTFQERLAASEELARILDKQEETQLRLAGLEVQRAQQAIKINGDNIENQVALINALAEQDAIEADIAGRRAEQEAQDRALRQEILQARQDEIGNLIDTENLRVEVVEESVNREVEARLRGIQTEAEMREKEAEKEKARAKNLEDFKLNIAQAGLASLALLAEQGSGFAKAVGVAQAIISTYQGINKALAETTDFTPTQTLRFANAAAVGIAGFANVANILKQQPVAKGGGAGGATPSQPKAPSFNIVGQSGVNQLAETLNQDQEPVQAFVVGNDVTTQQELDRNVVNTATIG